MEAITTLESLASREGMSYKTLPGSIIHKYASGNLVDVPEARKALPKP